MSPKNFKNKIWNHFGVTLFLVLVLSLIWEFGLEGVIKSSIQMSSSNGASWFDAGVHISIVLLAMLFTLPGLLGGAQETGKKTVIELGKTERRYKSIVESTNDLILQLDGHGIVVFANPAVRLLGYEDGEMVGEFIDLLGHAKAPVQNLPPITSSIRGKLKETSHSEESYKKHLQDKYG